jgi:hypothetical protein
MNWNKQNEKKKYIYVVGQPKIRLGQFEKFFDWPKFQVDLQHNEYIVPIIRAQPMCIFYCYWFIDKEHSVNMQLDALTS